jgi:arylsulfatase A-like enzyme
VLRDAYDGDVRMADEYFGRILDALAARGVLERSVVVLTSDHGEEFLEHGGVAHGQTLYVESLHVPLLVRLPGGRAGGRSVDRLAQHVDVVPTVLDALGLPPRPELSGSSLLRNAGPGIEACSSLRLGPFALDSLTGDGWKVVRTIREPRNRRFEVYDTERDPAERVDRAASAPVLVGYARTRFQDLAAPRPPGPPVPEDRLERVRALGYVSD